MTPHPARSPLTCSELGREPQPEKRVMGPWHQCATMHVLPVLQTRSSKGKH